MTTTEKRSLFIAPLVDGAADFIKARGAAQGDLQRSQLA